LLSAIPVSVGVEPTTTAPTRLRSIAPNQTPQRAARVRRLSEPPPRLGSGEGWESGFAIERFEHEQFDFHVWADVVVGDEGQHVAA
jgi:hypothetical protein